MIAVGAAILVAGVLADNVNLWLKQVASRPGYKYLLTLDDPISEYRNWWQMIPNLAGSNDSYKSWPSGNMTIASMMFSLMRLQQDTYDEPFSYGRVLWNIDHVSYLFCGEYRFHEK